MDLDKIAAKYPRAKIARCAERGCNLGSMPKSEFPVLKGEIVDPDKMCDCLVSGSDGRIALVELKNTVQHANKIFEKFRNSVAASLNIAAEADSKARCVALVLLAKHGRNTEHIAITSRWIAGKYRITGSCVDPLAKFADRGT